MKLLVSVEKVSWVYGLSTPQPATVRPCRRKAMHHTLGCEGCENANFSCSDWQPFANSRFVCMKRLRIVDLTHDVEHHVGRHEAVGRGEDGYSQGAADQEHAQEKNGAVKLRQEGWTVF